MIVDLFRTPESSGELRGKIDDDEARTRRIVAVAETARNFRSSDLL